jgi:hypothetical protein
MNNFSTMQDYTLAQYKPETFEHLAYTQTVTKLTENFGYPQSLKSLSFDWCATWLVPASLCTRGCLSFSHSLGSVRILWRVHILPFSWACGSPALLAEHFAPGCDSEVKLRDSV